VLSLTGISQLKMNIALVSYQNKKITQSHLEEDFQLSKFLESKGLFVKRAAWNDVQIDWKQFDVVLLKSPWDYHDHFDSFIRWLSDLNRAGIKVLNPFKTVLWNIDKHYLKQIADDGLPVIRSVFLEKGTVPDLAELLANFRCEKMIVKPCISASAKNTMLVTFDNVSSVQHAINGLLATESFLVQPFMEEILQGELSFMFFNGNFSHSTIKVPKTGDFRVQSEYGGTVQKIKTDNAIIQAAGKYVEMYGKGSLYARVDGIISNGIFVLMELELIEPYLFLNCHEPGFDNYYQGLLQLIA
jgi:glutathione synthase/RimK-type ligase-like ATP-grasp enzyme